MFLNFHFAIYSTKNDKKIHIFLELGQKNSQALPPGAQGRKKKCGILVQPASDIHVLCDKEILQFEKEIEKN